MCEPIVDENKVIKVEPQYRVWGVLVENEKHGKRLILGGKIAIVCGIIGVMGLIAMLSYFYYL